MSDGDFRSECDIGKSSFAALCIKTLLELTLDLKRECWYLTTHETIAVTRINKTKEMNAKHGHVKDDRNDNKTECSSEEMAHKHILHCVRIDHPGARGDVQG